MTTVKAPKLDIDSVLYPREGRLEARQMVERFIVANLIQQMDDAGFVLIAVYDGDEVRQVSRAKDAMELVFNLDVAVLIFSEAVYGGEQQAVLTIGNGTEIITDWVWAGAEGPKFNEAMEAFDAKKVLASALIAE